MTDAYARFIAAESARLRSHGIPEARIAWLLGTKPANANTGGRPGRRKGTPAGWLRDTVVELCSSRPMTVPALVAATGRTGGTIRVSVNKYVRDGDLRRVAVGDIRTGAVHVAFEAA